MSTTPKALAVKAAHKATNAALHSAPFAHLFAKVLQGHHGTKKDLAKIVSNCSPGFPPTLRTPDDMEAYGDYFRAHILHLLGVETQRVLEALPALQQVADETGRVELSLLIDTIPQTSNPKVTQFVLENLYGTVLDIEREVEK